MSWTILVHRHNKFWGHNITHIRWGRLGTMGVGLSCSYSVIKKKVSEKLNKGYRWATDEEYDEFFPKKLINLWEL